MLVSEILGILFSSPDFPRNPFEKQKEISAILRFKDSLLMMVMQCAIRLEDNVPRWCPGIVQNLESKSWPLPGNLLYLKLLCLIVVLLYEFVIFCSRTSSLDLIWRHCGKFPDLFRDPFVHLCPIHNMSL